MILDSLKKRVDEIEYGLEPETVQVRLRTGQERQYSKAEVMQAFRDACSGNDTPLLSEITKVSAYRDDPAGLIPWVQIATVLRYSRKRGGNG